MKPVKIRYWGILPLTRRGFYIYLIVGWSLAILVVIAAMIYAGDAFPRFRLPWESLPLGVKFTVWNYLAYNIWSVFILCVIGQLFDIVIMLRKYRQKEEEQQARMTMTQEHFDN
jgi:hypothetical protein